MINETPIKIVAYMAKDRINKSNFNEFEVYDSDAYVPYTLYPRSNQET